MKKINQYILEKLKVNKDSQDKDDLDKEMEEWDKRMKEPFGQLLKQLQKTVTDLGLYAAEKDEYGIMHYTPFDNYISMYAIDGDKKLTYERIKSVCGNYDFIEEHEIDKLLRKLKNLI